MKIKYKCKQGIPSGSFVRLNDQLLTGLYSACKGKGWRYSKYADGNHYLLGEDGNNEKTIIIEGNSPMDGILQVLTEEELKTYQIQKY